MIQQINSSPFNFRFLVGEVAGLPFGPLSQGFKEPTGKKGEMLRLKKQPYRREFIILLSLWLPAPTSIDSKMS